jgi:hypothetical protein
MSGTPFGPQGDGDRFSTKAPANSRAVIEAVWS